MIIQGICTPAEFWDLCHYDYILYCHRLFHIHKTQKEQSDFLQSCFRMVYTKIHNAHFKEKLTPERAWPIGKDEEIENEKLEKVREILKAAHAKSIR